MTLSAKFLAVEAILFFLPAVAFMVLAVPEIVLANLEGDGRASLSLGSALIFAALLAAGLYSLWIAMRLVMASIKGRPFEFDAGFWLGVASGTAVTVYLWTVSGVVLAILLTGPLVVLCAHAIIIRR